MTPLFGWLHWPTRRPPQGEFRLSDVTNESRNAELANRYHEIRTLLTAPISDTDRAMAEDLRQRWLASRDMGC